MAAELERLERASQLRRLRIAEGRAGVLRNIDGRDVLVACANDTLDLAGDERVIDAAARAMRDLGAGATASALVSGFTRAHAVLARSLSEFRQAESALLFASGYHANLGVIPALVGRGDRVIVDRLAHASIIDGCRLAGAKLARFPHNDSAQLAAILARPGRHIRTLVIVEGVYSMEGDRAPLAEIRELCRRHDAMFMLDDAHGFGVMGANGRGSDEQAGMLGACDIYMATLGKAMGAAGAFVSGSRVLTDLLLNRARTQTFSTAMPPATAAAATAALAIAAAEPHRRKRALATAARATRALAAPHVAATAPAQSHIVPIILGTSARALIASAALMEDGIYVQAIRPPTVPKMSARLRLSFSAGHTDPDVDRIVAGIARAIATLPAPAASLDDPLE